MVGLDNVIRVARPHCQRIANIWIEMATGSASVCGSMVRTISPARPWYAASPIRGIEERAARRAGIARCRRQPENGHPSGVSRVCCNTRVRSAIEPASSERVLGKQKFSHTRRGSLNQTQRPSMSCRSSLFAARGNPLCRALARGIRYVSKSPFAAPGCGLVATAGLRSYARTGDSACRAAQL